MTDGEQTAFEAFCLAGLWPGLGRTVAARLPEARINGPDDVSVDTLAKVEGVTPARAEKLAKAFTGAAARYAVVELLHPVGLPARLAAGVVEELGAGAVGVLHRDPWRLLGCAAGGTAPA